MANFALLWKARIIEKCRLEYEQEKINSVLNSNVEIPRNTLTKKWSRSYNMKKRLIERFRNLYPEGSSVSNFFVYLTTDQTFPNFLMKSVIGFIGGIVFTYLCFMFFVFQLSISLMHATIMSSIIGVLLTLGLAFSYRVRCLTFLLVPQFFSRVGRYTLTCYALVLILTGPATNTLKNSEVLSESMACNQEQIKISVKHITDSIKNPFNAMKDWIKVMTEGIKGVTNKVKTLLVSTNRMVITIASILESSFPWLNTVTTKCNSKLGTPYHYCSRMLRESDSDSTHQQRTKLPRTCDVTYLADVSCYSLKPHKRICEIADYTRTTIVATMKRKFQNFANRIQSLFLVKIHVHHSYSFSSNASRSASQVAAGIVTEIRNRADPLLTWLSWSSCVTSLFLLLIIFRAKNYQHMYETGSRFDNRYITKELRNLDFERLKEGKETILPLNRREKAKYITTTSFRLLASERVHLTRSVVHMVITTFKLLIHMAADYSLYWVLMTIRYNWRFQTPLQPGPTDAGVKVAGSGPVADMLRSLISFLTLPLSTPPSSTVSCLPNPYPPDLYRYTQIGVLIFLLWFFALFEPYGLRLSHVIMGHYRPERAKARAFWLYNHILRSRGGFMKYARRKLHKDYKYLKRGEFTFAQWLDSCLPCWWLRYLLGTLPKDPNCLVCGTAEKPNSPDSKLLRCDTNNCPGVYCNQCFNDLGLLCTICLNPVDYGDLSDVSLEKGSSDDSNSECHDYDEKLDPDDDHVFSQQIMKQKKYRNKKECMNKTFDDDCTNKDTNDHSDSLKKTTTSENGKKLIQRNLLTHKWFDNYYSLLPNNSSLSLKTIMKANRTANSVSDYGMSRSLRYYCSIGNTEFDQIDCPDNATEKRQTSVQAECKETQKPIEHTVTSISNRSVIDTSGTKQGRRRFAPAPMSYTNTVGPSNLVQTVFRPSEHGSYVEDYFETQPKKPHKQLELTDKCPTAGYRPAPKIAARTASSDFLLIPTDLNYIIGPLIEAAYPHRFYRLVFATIGLNDSAVRAIGLKRESHTKPYIFRPAHAEDNSPEDPTLLTHPDPKTLPLCPPKRERGNFYSENCLKDPSRSTVHEVPELHRRSCSTNTKEQVPKECMTESKSTKDTEAIAKLLEHIENSPMVDELNHEDYRNTVMSPNCVFKLPQLRPVEPCLMPELEPCPSVSKLDCDHHTEKAAERVKKPRCDRQESRVRHGNPKLYRRLDSVTNTESQMRFNTQDRCTSQDRPDCRATCPSRDRNISQEKQDYLARLDRIQRQEGLKRRENQRRRELQEEQLKKEKNKAKMAKRALERCDSNIINCECDGGKRPLSKSTSTNLFSGSDKKSNCKRGQKTNQRTKTATCQCPPSPKIRLPRTKYKPPYPNAKSDTRFGSDEESVETMPSYHNLRVRRAAKTVPKPVPTQFPKTTCKSFPISKSETWTVHSESDIGDAFYHKRRRKNHKTMERSNRSKYCTPAMNDCCGCSDKPTPSSPSSQVTCSKSSCCTCPSERKHGKRDKCEFLN
ncbi:uncharacterized protein [Battus philenor]|uniref:uncharacterized protein n=1 Tax=Battus philenor TaxID=42288 RepID=UPI0035D0535D